MRATPWTLPEIREAHRLVSAGMCCKCAAAALHVAGYPKRTKRAVHSIRFKYTPEGVKLK